MDAGSFEKVYKVVRKIPEGKVTTYGQIVELTKKLHPKDDQLLARKNEKTEKRK